MARLLGGQAAESTARQPELAAAANQKTFLMAGLLDAVPMIVLYRDVLIFVCCPLAVARLIR